MENTSTFNEFAEHLEIRNEIIDGEGPWFWIKQDQGAWTGPQKDWQDLKPKLKLYCKSFDSVVCAGGNQGMYPRLYSRMFNSVYTFEPDPLNYHTLCLNCQRPNIIKIQAGLGKETSVGKVDIKNMLNTGTHSIVPGSGMVPILKLDNFKFNNLSLLQLDVERMEYEVMLGAQKTIEEHKPLIVVEVVTEPMKKLLDSMGYYFLDRTGHADFIFGYIKPEH